MEQNIELDQEPVIIQQGGGAVNSVNGQTGDVVLTTSDLENTSDYQTGNEVQSAIDTAIGQIEIPTKVSELQNDSDFQNAQQVANAVAGEASLREAADNSLQGQIDAITASSDVTDIVGTYAALQSYDTSTLGNNDIIKVLQDESQNDETTYYRWSTATQSFTLIGEEGPYYTKSAADQKFQDKLTAGSNISIDPLTKTISASFDAETIFYANLNETGTSRHIYKDIAFTTAASAQDLIDANDVGQVILRGTSTANPTAYSDSYLQNAFIMPHNNDFEFVFLDRDLRYEYTAGATTDTVFYYSTSEIQPKLTAGTNVTITGTTISATDTTYSDFTGTDGQAAGTSGLVPAPATTDAGKFLKADGTWDTAGSPINVVQTTGTSTADVMSQDATTKMIFPDITNKSTCIGIGKNIEIGGGTVAGITIIGDSARGSGNQSTVIGQYAQSTAAATSGAIVIGGGGSYPGNNAKVSAEGAIAIGGNARASAKGSVAFGKSASATTQGEVNIGATTTSYSYNNTGYRLLRGVHDGVQDHDATTLGQLNARIVGSGTAAPTTSTVGSVGSLYAYVESGTGHLAICTDDTGGTYTWQTLV